MDARVEHDTSLVRLLTRDIVARSTLAWSTLEINFLFPHIHVLRLFSSDVLSLRTCAQYASMNKFTCSEHSVRIRT